jgi:hypothetical protein
VASVRETTAKRSDNAESNVSSIKVLWLETFGLSEVNAGRLANLDGEISQQFKSPVMHSESHAKRLLCC